MIKWRRRRQRSRATEGSHAWGGESAGCGWTFAIASVPQVRWVSCCRAHTRRGDRSASTVPCLQV